jgi:hypothetical protein
VFRPIGNKALIVYVDNLHDTTNWLTEKEVNFAFKVASPQLDWHSPFFTGVFL